MKEAIIIYKKKKYINWFINSYKLKRMETAKILNFLLKRDNLLLHTHFVENVRRLPNAIIISAVDAVTVSFLCRLNDVYYEDVEEIINVLDSSPPEELFIWLSFDREHLCSLCGSVLEVKPQIQSKVFYHQVIKDLENELNQKIRKKEENRTSLQAEIDLALDQGNRELFISLSIFYKKLFA